jgi:pimeloyl-ACP methyl ester carboxylesterase
MSNDDEPQRRTWKSQGLTLSYVDWGNEGAPLLVLLHGNGDHARSWDETARALRKDWHVVAPDQRGHGDSQWSPDGAYFTPYHLLDFVDLIETLKAPRVTLVAHSFGGAIAVRYAALFPDRVEKIAIVDGLGPATSVTERWAADGPLNRSREWIERRREISGQQLKRFASVEEAAKRIMQHKHRPRLTYDFAMHLARHGVRPEGDGYVFKRDPFVTVFSLEDFVLEGPASRGAVQAPVLLFWGPESWTQHPDEDGRATPLKNHRTITYPEAGHWAHHDQFDAFIADLRAFLAA